VVVLPSPDEATRPEVELPLRQTGNRQWKLQVTGHRESATEHRHGNLSPQSRPTGRGGRHTK